MKQLDVKLDFTKQQDFVVFDFAEEQGLVLISQAEDDEISLSFLEEGQP